MNFSEIKTRFLRTLNRRDITPSEIEAFIEDAIIRAQRLLNVPASETVYEATVGEGFTKLLIPADYIRAISISVDGIELTRGNLTQVSILSRISGQPTWFVREENALILGPCPAAGATIKLVYQSNFAALQSDTDKNFLTEIGRDIVVAGAMSEACDFFTDPRKPTYEEKFLKGITDLNIMAQMDELSNAAIAPAIGFNFDE